MAKVFLDTNSFIDTVVRRPEKEIISNLESHELTISSLSIHIYCYAFKIKIPTEILNAQLTKFKILELTSPVLTKALKGPTTDFEDNVQLHSCATEDCDIFLTSDKNLLKLKFFGKAHVLPQIASRNNN